ncbi:MAG: ATPase domain-containing protein [Methanolobus sp.]|jgi:KaiC/GvpD/RAD55 family RecA-like ATPase|nr:ATPase domain-containing protein [Methanolobus sp.]
MTRISSGNIDLDKRLQGGLSERECILITGEPGTGKTIFSIQYLYNACKQGKKCAMIATEETPEKIITHAKALGFDLEPFVQSKQLSMLHFLEMRAKNVTGGYNNVTMYADDLNNIGHIIPKDTEVVVLDNMALFQ